MFSTNTSFLDLLSSFTPDPNLQPALPNDDTFGTFDECNSQYSDNSSASNSDIRDESDDGSEVAAQSYSQGVMNFMNEVGDASDEDPDEKVRIDVWSESENKIPLGMQFENKKQVKKAVTLWSIANNREYKVLESKSHKWVAQCKSVYQNRIESSSEYTPNCAWYVRAIKKKNHHLWKITRWVDAHNCFGSCIGNNNRNLNSETIASYILHSIEKDVEYPVKSIQADIKNKLNVDVSYWKAWHSRRKAIETLYGTWESNFDMLPEYIAALEASNPNTVVKWFHDPYSSSNVVTFKYIFWAFGPAISAFHLCPPIISIDGAHLKGSYKGKLLVAVTKDANNNILPIAYAIVDEETTHSWFWFLYQFRHFVAYDRQLCVISDRHKGMIHAMSNMVEWKEPLAYHRFCLRHIRSNFMKKFKNLSLKKFCWFIGSTTQERKFVRYKREIKELNPEAWQYLKQIDKSQWCLLYDENRRWGCLTTNISESINNALRGARRLPIKSCIDLTFNRTVALFRKHSATAMSCNTPLPHRMWRKFSSRDIHAQSHHLSEFNYNEGVYKIVTKLRINDTGGNTHTVYYFQQTCTCGKWQMERFPCSHALAVCRHRGDNPLTIIHNVYTTATFRQQYLSHFTPLPHVDYWLNSGWKIKADNSKINVSRGRKKSSRIRNEMDIRHPDKPKRCGLCRQVGHTRSTCTNSQSRFNSA